MKREVNWFHCDIWIQFCYRTKCEPLCSWTSKHYRWAIDVEQDVVKQYDTVIWRHWTSFDSHSERGINGDYLGSSLVFYPRPIEERISLSHDKISQSPPSFSCYLNWGVEYHTWDHISMYRDCKPPPKWMDCFLCTHSLSHSSTQSLNIHSDLILLHICLPIIYKHRTGIYGINVFQFCDISIVIITIGWITIRYEHVC